MPRGGEWLLESHSAFKSAPAYSFRNASVPKDRGRKIPGPGEYPLLSSEKDKHKRMPSYTMAGSRRGKEYTLGSGPGAYSPSDPNHVSPQVLFSAAQRLAKLKGNGVPGPGSYAVPSTLGGRGITFKSKPQSRPRTALPGPGQHTPLHGVVSHIASCPSISFGGASKGTGRPSTAPPGPGTYDLETPLPKKGITIKGKYPLPEPEVTPGPQDAGRCFRG